MRIESTATSVSALDSSPVDNIASAANGANKDEFLRLLVAQLQHQDPLQPQDSAAFVAQLAQFASVEQAAETNQRLASLEGAYASTTRAGYTNLVGKTVTARSDSISWPASAETLAHLSGTASQVTVTIRDASGNEVKTFELGPRSEGDVAIGWNGTNAAGAQVPDGQYTFEISAKSADGSPVEAYAEIRGVIDAIEFLGGAARFRIGNQKITPADILAVSDGAARPQ